MSKRAKSYISIFAIISFSFLTLTQWTAESGAAAAPSFNWQYAGWSGGGAFPSFGFDPNTPGHIFVLSDVSGVYSSTDRGNSWTRQNQGLSNICSHVIAISSWDPNIIYVGSGYGIHKSTDGGQTWVLLPGTDSIFAYLRPYNYKSITIDRLNPNKVYAGTSDGKVYFTNDGGNTWSRLGSVTYPFGSSTNISAAYLTRDSSSLFIGSDLGLRRYDFSTGVWTAINTGGNAVSDIVGYNFTETIYVTYGKKVAWTTDKGQTWQYSSDTPISSGVVNRLSVTTGQSGNTKILATWASGWNGGVYLSENAGANWTNIGTNTKHFDAAANPTRSWISNFANFPLSINFDPFQPNTIYTSDFWGVWRSDDNGLNWYERIRYLPNTVGTSLAVASDGSLLAGAMDNGLMRSRDGGVTYQPLVPTANFKGNNVNGHIWRIKAIGANKIVATNTPWDSTYHNQVLISEDGGATFAVVTAGLPTVTPVVNTNWWQGFAKALAVDPTNPSKMYLGIDGDDGGGFFYSTDGGYHWSRSAGQPGSKRVFNGLSVDPIEPNRIFWGASANGGGVYRSEDSGQSWRNVLSSPNWIFDVAVAKDQTVYAGGDNSGPVLYVSHDKGTTWSLLKRFSGTAGPCLAITPDPNNVLRMAVSTVLWAGFTSGKIYLTEDGGKTWTDITSNFPNSDGASALAFSSDSGTLYASAIAGSVYKLSLTPMADTTVPTAPSNVTAQDSLGNVKVSWTASTDNVAVTGYQVFRDSAQIGTSATTTYTDSAVTVGTTYTYAIKAFDAANNVSASSSLVSYTVAPPASDTTPPTAPGIYQYALLNGTVTLSWDASTDNVAVQGYKVYRNNIEIGSTSTTSFADSAIVEGSTYVYVAKAFDAAGNLSAVSNAVTIAVPAAPVAAPQVLSNSRSNITSTSAVINWTTDVPATGYVRFGRDAYTMTTLTPATTTASTSGSTTMSGLLPSTWYHYQIVVQNAGGSTVTAEQAFVTAAATTDTTAPSAPVGLSALLVNNTINLSWSASSDDVGVTGYKVYRNNAEIASVSAVTFVDALTVAGATYNYTAKAFDAAGNLSAVSNAVTIAVPAAPVAAPQVLSNSRSNITSTSAVINWTTDVPATGYAQYGRDAYTMTTLTPATTTASTSGSTTMSGLLPSTWYHYQIVVQNAGGSTVTAEQAFVTAPPSTILNVTASSITSTTATISWTSSVPATGYVRYGFDAYTQPWTSYTTPTIGTAGAIILTQLENNRWYHYRVVVQNGGGTSTTSTDNYFKTKVK